jgi:hypothetical protein
MLGETVSNTAINDGNTPTVEQLPEALPIPAVVVQTTYTKLDAIPTLKVLVKRGAYVTPTIFSVTSMLELVQDDMFIQRVNANLVDLYLFKVAHYTTLIDSITKQIRREEADVYSMSYDRHPEDHFPMLKSNKLLRNKLIRFVSKASGLSAELASVASATINTRNRLIRAITDSDHGVVSLLGSTRDGVRSMLLEQIFLLSRTSRIFTHTFNNIILTGASGVGKTKLAQVTAYVLQQLGVLLTDTVLLGSPCNLVSKYVGDSAIKAQGVMHSGLEGVIFIDEAYQLTTVDGSGRHNTHGQEALTEVVNFLDKFIGMSVVIAAGYERPMITNFLGANEGIARRFPFQYKLADYCPGDLFNIFMSHMRTLSPGFDLTPEARVYVFTLLTRLHKFNVFPRQCGDMLNLASLFTRALFLLEHTRESGDADPGAAFHKAVDEYLGCQNASMAMLDSV